MRSTYRCAECGNTSSVPMRCCGTPMRDEEERVAHIHGDVSRGICSAMLERTPNEVRGKALYRCPVCGHFELAQPRSRPGVACGKAGEL